MLGWAMSGLVMFGVGKKLRNYDLEVYGIRIAIAADQFANVFAAGFPDETISARVGRAVNSRRPKPIAKVLNVVINTIAWFDPNHTVASIEWDEKFDQRYEPWPFQEWSQRELDAKRIQGR